MQVTLSLNMTPFTMISLMERFAVLGMCLTTQMGATACTVGLCDPTFH